MGSDQRPLLSARLIFMFIPCLVLVLFFQTNRAQDLNHRHYCPPSSCGNIPKIIYPFRLRTDPPGCGSRRYELSCENNVTTVLHLYSGKYYVQSINYNNYTIRVVDSNVEKGNCSSLPRYPLTSYNISYRDPYSTDILRKIGRNKQIVSLPISQPVIFFKCEIPVNSSDCIPTTPCINTTMSGFSSSSDLSSPNGYSYAKIGSKSASELKDSCRIELMTMMRLRGTLENRNVSYKAIHNELANGFELSWLQCFAKKGKPGSIHKCYTDDSDRVRCSSCDDYWGLIDAACAMFLGGRLVLGIPCVISLLIYKWRKRHLSMYHNIEEFLQTNKNLMPIRYSYSDIRKMTRVFKQKLGEGGFGCVYKGKLRSGRLVAIKVLGKSKANGEDFINEVATIGRIHHVNVVHLVGFCVEGSKRALVYDFMFNGSLDKYIYFQEENNSLDYKKLYEISLGVARGVEYLHRGCNMQILHFDIKPHNILLDENFVPKVSDFGLARLCPLEKSIVSLTAARGTMGYMAPELFYRNIGGVSYKADVYSFGMLLMEMASGRKNLNAVAEHTSQIYFPSWVYDKIIEGNDLQMEDAMTEEEPKIRKKMIIVALWCIQMKPSKRPSMNKVIQMLEGEIESLQMPPKPFLCPEQKSVEDVGEASNSKCSTIPSEDDDNEETCLFLNSNNNNKFVDVKGKLKVHISFLLIV
ncbi:hypothetical protein FNV43_RR24974 [Rhamnella rubrinervis]|uniref:Protein kinase domain-containing protein n=1 Tax=Rhamnella rubrinervis TaxID=2594499 RepID=A0A8K0GQR1_9ROSA|nr:hypothetical protein FNV43_RR24974 [Rhamnella rubrinervis]